MWGLVAASDVWMEIEMMSLRNNFKTSWTLQTWGLDFQNYAVLDKFCFFGVGDLSKLQHLRAVRMAGLWRPALDWRMWTSWSCFSFQTICRIGQGADLVIKYENDSPGPILSYHTASSVPESGRGVWPSFVWSLATPCCAVYYPGWVQTLTLCASCLQAIALGEQSKLCSWNLPCSKWIWGGRLLPWRSRCPWAERVLTCE